MNPPKPQAKTADELLTSADQRHLAGDLAEARRLCREALALEPGHAGALYRCGLMELQEGRMSSALDLIQRAVAARPDAVRYQFGLGQALSGLGRQAEAAAAYRKLIAAEPRLAEPHYGLGLSLQALGELPSAIAAYQDAIRRWPEYAEAHNNLGNCLQKLGRLAEAEAAYRRVLALRPDFAAAMANLGALLPALGRPDDAIEFLERAARLEPGVASHRVNLGAVLCRLRRYQDAAQVLAEAVRLDGAIPEAAYNLGSALHHLGRIREAAEQYRRAVALRPGYAEALNNLGNACKALGDFPAALEAFQAAMRADPRSAAARSNAAGLFRVLGRMEEAQEALREALALDPLFSPGHSNLGNVLKDCGDLAGALDCFRRAVELDPADALAHSNLAYTLSFATEDGAAILEECRRWDARHGRPLLRSPPRWDHDRSPERRLRLGYLSGDFRNHCQSFFTVPLLSHHDRDRFEVFCYSSVERPDDVTRRIEGLASVWRNVGPLSDAELCDAIRRDRIDVLVDLEMHMANGRPQVLARRAAPVQIAWLAYPGTTGMQAIDRLLLDPRLAPDGAEPDYSEQVVRLADTFWCYDPLAAGPAVNDLPALAAGRVTFGSLNAPCKVTDRTIELWGGVLRAVPESLLLLMAPPSGYRRRLLEKLAAAGVAAGRVEILPFQPRADYLRTYHRIDLALDTFPYNGHTTSLDAFWMGVPVVSRIGRTAVSRAGLSQLFNLGLDELAAASDGRFVEIAVALARDLPRLAALRRGLRPRMERSPLMDAPRFARAVETACRDAWRHWCRG